MLIVVRVIGVSMEAKILTTIIQVIIGGLTYLISIFILYKVVYKQNIINYIKKMIKE